MLCSEGIVFRQKTFCCDAWERNVFSIFLTLLFCYIKLISFFCSCSQLHTDDSARLPSVIKCRKLQRQRKSEAYFLMFPGSCISVIRYFLAAFDGELSVISLVEITSRFALYEDKVKENCQWGRENYKVDVTRNFRLLKMKRKNLRQDMRRTTRVKCDKTISIVVSVSIKVQDTWGLRSVLSCKHCCMLGGLISISTLKRLLEDVSQYLHLEFPSNCFHFENSRFFCYIPKVSLWKSC